MECPECQFDNCEVATFCRKCGASLIKEIICHNSRAINPPDSSFCETCGDALQRINGLLRLLVYRILAAPTAADHIESAPEGLKMCVPVPNGM